MLDFSGPLFLSVLFIVGSYVLSGLPAFLWGLIISNEWARSALVYPLMTSAEALILYILFYFVDMFASKKRLVGPIKSELSLNTYLEATKLAAKNMLYMMFFLVAITYSLSGDIHGGYSIQGITPCRFPELAPNFNRLILEMFVIIFCTDFFMYWLHRAHHIRPLYRLFHSIHHQYPNPVAAHATSVHIVELLSVAPFIFIVPRLLYEIFGLHPLSVYLSSHLFSLHGVLEHCGYDDYLEYFTFGVMSASKMHFVHHQIPRANYGFYTYFWDWVFGTKLSYDNMTLTLNLRAKLQEENLRSSLQENVVQ